MIFLRAAAVLTCCRHSASKYTPSKQSVGCTQASTQDEIYLATQRNTILKRPVVLVVERCLIGSGSVGMLLVTSWEPIIDSEAAMPDNSLMPPDAGGDKVRRAQQSGLGRHWLLPQHGTDSGCRTRLCQCCWCQCTESTVQAILISPSLCWYQAHGIQHHNKIFFCLA